MNELTPQDLQTLAKAPPSGPSLAQRIGTWLSGPSLNKAPGDGAGAGIAPFMAGGSASGRPPRRGASQMLGLYEEIPQLRAVIDKIGQGLVSTPYRILLAPSLQKAQSKAQRSTLRRGLLNRIAGPGHVAGPTLRSKAITKLIAQDELIDAEGHGLELLLNEPNGQMTGTQMFQLIQGHLDLVGESFGLIERVGNGDPRELWPIPPDWVSRLPQKGRNTFDITGGSYRMLDVPPDDLIWFKHLSLSNPYGRGSGLGATLNNELDADEYAARTIANVFWNDATPSMIISLEGMGTKEAEGFKAKFLQQHLGYLRARLPFITNKKLSIEQLTTKFTDLQLVELRRFLIDRVREVYGVPPEIMGDAKDSNRATITAAQFIFAVNVIMPRLIFLEDYINTRLIPKFTDADIILAFESPVPQDLEFVAGLVKQLPWAFSMDEIRALAEYEPLEGDAGKVHAIPFSVTMQEVGDIQSSDVSEEPAEEDLEDDLFGPEQETLRIVSSPSAKALDLDRISGALVDVPFEPLLRPVLTEHVADWIEVFEDRTGIRVSDSDIIRDLVRDELSEFAGGKIKMIDKFTLEGLRSSLSEGIRDGESAAQLEARVKEMFEGASTARARTIARTEVNRAANASADELMKIAKIEKREWVALFSNTRDTHASMDGQVQKVGTPFKSPSGATAQHPGGFGLASEDINCNCTILPVRSDKAYDRSAYWKAFDRTTERWAKRTASAMGEYFAKQQRAVIAEIKRQVKTSEPEMIRIVA